MYSNMNASKQREGLNISSSFRNCLEKEVFRMQKTRRACKIVHSLQIEKSSEESALTNPAMPKQICCGFDFSRKRTCTGTGKTGREKQSGFSETGGIVRNTANHEKKTESQENHDFSRDFSGKPGIRKAEKRESVRYRLILNPLTERQR